MHVYWCYLTKYVGFCNFVQKHNIHACYHTVETVIQIFNCEAENLALMQEILIEKQKLFFVGRKGRLCL